MLRLHRVKRELYCLVNNTRCLSLSYYVNLAENFFLAVNCHYAFKHFGSHHVIRHCFSDSKDIFNPQSHEYFSFF